MTTLPPRPRKKIGAILDKLASAERFARPAERVPGEQRICGVPLLAQSDGSYFLDAGGIRIFSGMAAFIGFLARQAAESCHSAPADVLLTAAVDAAATPELAALGIRQVAVVLRAPVARAVAARTDLLAQGLHAVFAALQSPAHGGRMFPDAFAGAAAEDEEPPALLLPLAAEPDPAAAYFLFVEYDRAARFLRCTVEDSRASRLQLKRLPHQVLPPPAAGAVHSDLPALAAAVYAALRREYQNHASALVLVPEQQAELFGLLAGAGLPALQRVALHWTAAWSARQLRGGGQEAALQLLARLLAVLRDGTAAQLLQARAMLVLADADERVYLDVSRHGTALNCSIGARRRAPDMAGHLQRLPALAHAAAAVPPALLGRQRVVLIHHLTTETLGFMQALAQAGCAALTTLFIRYRGSVPEAYLDDLHSLPETRFRCHALQEVTHYRGVQNAFVLARNLSNTTGLAPLEQVLAREEHDYFSAMRQAALHLFFCEAIQARGEGRQVLLIEDGGYVAPELNRLCRAGATLGEALRGAAVALPVGQPATEPLAAWLVPLLTATFEHTRNGMQYLEAEAAQGPLHIPALTIAVSKFKSVHEGEACAQSILGAIEAICAGLGRTLLYRQVLLLGSRGVLGMFLREGLRARLRHGGLYGIDLAATAPAGDGIAEAAALAEVPDTVRRTLDLFIGVTGISLLTGDWLTALVLEGEQQELFFASGSTKTAEFTDMLRWLRELQQPGTMLRGIPVYLTWRSLRDPQTGLLLGHAARLQFPEDADIPGTRPEARWKDLFMLGDAMPVNFVYYGVPGEVIDGVFAELFALVTGAAARLAAGEVYLFC
ncbi:MAG TPA: hypothetical protein PKM88_08555, partial [bacterium]|nr:hypothetical protein [bacterium]